MPTNSSPNHSPTVEEREERLIKQQMDGLLRLRNELRNFKKDGPNKRTKHHFNTRLNRMKTTRSDFVGRHNQIIQISSDESDPYFKEDIFDQFENEYIDIVSSIETEYDVCHSDRLSISKTNTNVSISTDNSSLSGMTQPIHHEIPFKLPELSIPRFNGNYVDWPSFYDSFLQIHNHDRLSNSQKFTYLKGALSNNVKAVLGNLDITSENYITAWSTLIERFNNKRVLFSNFFEKFSNQPVIVNESAQELQLLHDTSKSCIVEIQKLGVSTDLCGELLAFILVKKLPTQTRLEWEKQLGKSTVIPKFDTLIEFLNTRFRTLEAMYPQSINKVNYKSFNNVQASSSKSIQMNRPIRKEIKNFHVSSKNYTCPICVNNKNHLLRKCPVFLQHSPHDRKLLVDKYKICINCLSHANNIPCSSTITCFTCNNKHHTLLHFGKSLSSIQNEMSKENSTSVPYTNLSEPPIVSNNFVNSTNKTVLLTTALIDVPNSNGQLIRLRALVDQGSQQSIITERAAQKLNLSFIPLHIGYKPMGESQYKIANKGMNINIHSIIDKGFTVSTTVAVIPSISSELPMFPVKMNSWSHITCLNLADPYYATPGQIDLLLAGDVYGKIIQSGLCKGGEGEPIAQNTSLGWILFGEIAQQNHVISVPVSCFHVSTFEISQYIKKFHELEEIPCEKSLSQEDAWSENFFNSTTVRQSDGKFMVRLPLKSHFDSSAVLGNSFSTALKRFRILQRRFSRDENFRNEYFKVFNEYKGLNQVKRIYDVRDAHFYLPHHAVLKESSQTTKLRQVFDGSVKSSNGNSLNDILTTGPSLQTDLVSIILNWRVYKYVFLSDIEKMYRCIQVHPDDTHYQLVLWQSEDSNELETYALQTVTFGLSTSPYQAIKTLHYLAELERETFPLAYDVIKYETYVDDVSSGHETIEGAIDKAQQTITMLRGAGFELRKWSSNSKEILSQIPQEYQDQSTTCLFSSGDSIKALGLHWSTVKDAFEFTINFPIPSVSTKRSILSTIARLFDPLGWINPIVTKAKLILSQLWEMKLSWDEPISSSLQTEWQEFIAQFQFINQINIPRWIYVTSSNQLNEIHVFCDSSMKAYAASVYLRTIDSENNIHCNLLIAKSKLTPNKQILTIPRAELCGAVLAVRLFNSVKSMLRLNIHRTTFWTDSSVVLSWIQGDPNRWAIFVCNRINKILSSTEINQWYHIDTKNNPADHNSRGLHVKQLINAKLWWHGPQFLSLPQSHWPVSKFDSVVDDKKELRAKYKSMNLNLVKQSFIDSTIHRFSNLNRLLRTFAYVNRFIKQLKLSIKENSKSQSTIVTLSQSTPINSTAISTLIEQISPLSVQELQGSETIIIQLIQKDSFSSERASLLNKIPNVQNSKLIQLNPFLDEHQILRVNGRLKNAFMSFGEKYPIILPAKHHFVTLLIRNAHRITMHGGPQLTINHLRQMYWILNVRQFARHIIHKCVICFKQKPNLLSQQMGSLPSSRLNELSQPFSSTIVDYAGPYSIRTSKGRGQSSYKGYVAVFTCMTTKAIHLEAVGDLTSQTFLHALDRFLSRRGFCMNMYSDCGTNFVGAAGEINRSHIEFQQIIEKDIIPYLANRKIQWHFSPPGSPHFNGLVEAAVKSMKKHLSIVIADAKLTYEEFMTVLCKIEAILNSRPISQISFNSNDFTALTPGHFLIGNSLLSRAQPSININPTKRFQMMEQMTQHFWKRFRGDVLSTMQIRNKWKSTQPNLKVNDLVILKDDRFPVNCWPLARVAELHEGSDGLVRVVTVRTSSGMYKRAITKLALVPS